MDDRLTEIKCALDEAIATVANERLSDLVDELKTPDVTNEASLKIEASLDSLSLLQQGGTPVYNDWDALFYLTWYQPKQINILYSLLQWITQPVPSRQWIGDVFGQESGNTHVVDFGCGSLATMFAIAIAAAESHRLGNPVPKIVIDNIDQSSSMIKLGQQTWDKFVSLMKLRHPAHPICMVFDRIDYKTHQRSRNFRKKLNNTQCFVFAMHCVYKETIYSIRHELSSLFTAFEPDGLFITSHDSKSDLLERVAPEELNWTRESTSGTSSNVVQSQFGSGILEKTTEWRKKLANRLHNIGSGPCYIDLLQNDVKWRWSNFAYGIYYDINYNPTCYIPDDDLPF